MPTSSPAYISWRAFLSARHTPALALVCLGVWLHASDSLIVATMLPSIVTEIGGAAYVSWTVSIYEIGSVFAGAASALLSMRYGLRWPMGGAALLFAAGCALSAISPVMELVLAGRALQGLGGGGLVALSFVAAGVLFPRAHRARVMATVSAFWGMSAFLGPLLGGLFVEYATWRIGFWFFAAQAGLLALWIFRHPEAAPAHSTPASTGFPITRLALLCLAVLLISTAGVRVEFWRTTLLALAGLSCLIWFLWRDSKADQDRLLPHAPFDPRTATGGTLAMLLLISMSTIAILAYGPILMSLIHGMSALSAGYVVACSSIGWTLAAIAISGAPETQDRLWIITGMTLTALSVAAFTIVVPHGPPLLIAAASFAEGFGFGMAWTFILRRITALVPETEIARVSGAMPTVQRIGYALGAAFIGIVANASGFLNMDSAKDAAQVARALFLASLPLACLGLLAMIGLVRRHPYDDTL